MYMNAHHKVQGEVRMFEVDARNAIARFPAEWSAEAWPAEDPESVEVNTRKRGQPRILADKPAEANDAGGGAPAGG